MSGIVGLINMDGQPVDRQLLAQMTDFLDYRGPDAQEIWSEGQVGFGHTLLGTTFESERERQPCSLDGQVWITADARIDGRADLIRRLADLGCHELKDIPDAELILHAYRVWGEDCLRYLLGDFAFAIWDGRRRRLFCARDHFGIKPFYYAKVKNCLVFSNTLNCLRLHPQVSDELNELSIADFLLFEFNQDPATTTFADINRLPPAHYFILQEGALSPRCYWSLPRTGPLRYKRQSDYVEHFQELLSHAVSDRLRSRQVGVFMSGGLDSSTVASHAKAILAAESSQFDLRAYTIVFNWLIREEERRYSELVASHLNIPINFLAADDYELYEWENRGGISWPEPYNEVLIAIRMDLLRQAQKNCRVILTGEGGDPILYPSSSYLYKLLKGLEFERLIIETGRCVFRYHRLPQIGFRSGIKRWSSQVSGPAYPAWLNASFAARLDLPGRWQQFTKTPEPDHHIRSEAYPIILNSAWQYDFEKMHDPGATGLPVESRHPFFDIRLVTYAFALPPVPWCVDKVLLREAGRGFLPEAVRCRSKAPLGDDPILKRIRLSRVNLMECLTYADELAGYVDTPRVFFLTKDANSYKGKGGLIPLSLYHWLKHLRIR